MKKFVTIVPHIENLELRKDTGQIPYQFFKLLNYDSELVSYFYSLDGGRSAGPVSEPPIDQEEIHRNYPYLKSEVNGLKMHFLKYRGRGKFYERAIVSYLRANSKKIDILNLFHFSPENILYTLIYKTLNPNGKVYIKLDVDIHYYESRNYLFNPNTRFLFLKKAFFNGLILPLFFRLVNLLSAESEAAVNYFRKRFKVPSRKIALVLNGVDAERIESIRSFNVGEKENIIITVGRIGSTQKNNEMLLQALENIELGNWKVYFVGTIEKDFETTIKEFFKRHPEKGDSVVFTGGITTPEDLYELYNKAKIFCLTSVHEGFPLSACEAAYFGDYLVLTDSIHCFNELTDSGKNGIRISVNNTDELANRINGLISKPEPLEKSARDMRRYAVDKLTWQYIIPELNAKLL